MSSDATHLSTYDAPFLLDLDDASDSVSSQTRTRAPRSERKRSFSFEVGVVYARRSQLFLAVSPTTLLTFRAGEPQELRPTTPYAVARSRSVESLCRAWGISRETLDRLARTYVAPSPEGMTRHASRKRNGVEELVGLVLRRVRVAG